ncbi:hypothetical protein [Microlunatus sp. Y2014]|uniref:hypothetical protein n=1 Tax=Microlunatus sp. Y2014 TaxID=3418488 RepID=UPI003DA77617
MREAKHDNQIAIRGCVIRFDQRDAAGNTKPYIHANKSHICVGPTHLEVEDDGDLVVYDNTVGPIVSVAVSPDETMTANGLSCGASGGSGKTTIRCYDRDGNRIAADSPEMYAPLSNLWLTWFTWQDA